MYRCESWTIKKGWVPKNWCFPTVVLEKTFESSLDCKEMKPSILMEINPQYSLEGLTLTEDPILWAPDGKSQLGKDPDARKDWRQKEKRMAEDEMGSITNSVGTCCACASLFSHARLFAPYALQLARLLCPWDSPGQNTRVGCQALLQGILPTQGLNSQLQHVLCCRQMNLSKLREKVKDRET